MRTMILSLGVLSSLLVYPALGMDNLSIVELKSLIERELGGIQAFELQYAGTMTVPPVQESSAMSPEFCRKQIASLKQTLEKRKAGLLTPDEAVMQADITDDQIEDSIAKLEKMISGGLQFESYYVFSCLGNKMREDVFRANDTTGHHYYLFDGEKGYVIFPEKKRIDISPGFTQRWRLPVIRGGFGFNLDYFTGEGFTITRLDPQFHVIQTAPENGNPGEQYAFTLLRDNPVYWEKAEVLNEQGQVVKRVICENFDQTGPVWVPQVIKIQERQGINFHDSISLTLVSAKFNDAEFPPRFFELPQNDNYVTKTYNR